ATWRAFRPARRLPSRVSSGGRTPATSRAASSRSTAPPSRRALSSAPPPTSASPSEEQPTGSPPASRPSPAVSTRARGDRRPGGSLPLDGGGGLARDVVDD